MPDSAVGVWKLQSFYVENIETKEQSEPFGSKPRGILMLDPEGRMVALLTPRERVSPTTEVEQAAAFQKLIAYSGRYRIEPPNRFVTSVDVAWFESWIGTEQARTYMLDGDKLDIVSAPARLPRAGGSDAMFVGTLSWVREAGAIATEVEHSVDL